MQQILKTSFQITEDCLRSRGFITDENALAAVTRGIIEKALSENPLEEWSHYLTEWIYSLCTLAWQMVLQHPPMTLEIPRIGEKVDMDNDKIIPQRNMDFSRMNEYVIDHYLEPHLMHGAQILEAGRVKVRLENITSSSTKIDEQYRDNQAPVTPTSGDTDVDDDSTLTGHAKGLLEIVKLISEEDDIEQDPNKVDSAESTNFTDEKQNTHAHVDESEVPESKPEVQVSEKQSKNRQHDDDMQRSKYNDSETGESAESHTPDDMHTGDNRLLDTSKRTNTDSLKKQVMTRNVNNLFETGELEDVDDEGKQLMHPKTGGVHDKVLCGDNNSETDDVSTEGVDLADSSAPTETINNNGSPEVTDLSADASTTSHRHTYSDSDTPRLSGDTEGEI